MLRLTRDGDLWVAYTDGPRDRWPAKEAGLRYSPAGRDPVPASHVWWTDSIDKALALREFADDNAKAQLEGVAEQRATSLEASHAVDADADIPAPDGLDYLPYQRGGIAYAMGRRGTLIGDEMGLGKTIQAIGMINVDPSIKSVLVVCPASLKLNWSREIVKWSVRPVTTAIARGSKWRDEHVEDDAQVAVLIINYDILKRHRDVLRASEFDLLIVDEAHYLKNGKAQRTREVLGGRTQDQETRKWVDDPAPIPARRVAMLTGTPLTNRPSEGWTIFHALDPKTFSNWKRYVTRYCAAYQGRWGWDTSGASNLDELQAKLRSTIMVRRLKSEVLTELPPKRRQVIEMPVNGASKAVAAERAAFESWEAAREELAARIALAEASDDPEAYADRIRELRAEVSVGFTGMSKLRHDTAVSKVPLVIEHLHNAVEATGKVICFAHHKDVVKAISEEFGDEAVLVVGDTPNDKRQANVDRFQTDPECRLFVGNILAAGVGITLTAASHVVFAELDWVPGNVSQAEDRAHRIGQANSVLVQHLVLEGSLDAVMAQRIVEKQAVLDQALDADHGEIDLLPEVVATREQIEKQDEEVAKVRERQAKEAAKLNVTPALHDAVLEALRLVAGVCDGAMARDEMGFNGLDTHIGKDLAARDKLTPKQVVLGRKVVMKYKRQYPAELFNVMMASKKEDK